MSGYALGSLRLRLFFTRKAKLNESAVHYTAYEFVCWLTKKVLSARAKWVIIKSIILNCGIMLEFIWWTGRKVGTDRCRAADRRLRNTALIGSALARQKSNSEKLR